MNFSKATLASDGLVESKSGNIALTQPLKLVKNMMNTKRLTLVMDSESEEIYIYQNNVYKRISELTLKHILMEYFDSKYPDLWKPSFEAQYYSALINSLERKQMNSSKRYLNLNNGILDLETGKLRKHTQKLYSTIKVNINFDAKSEAPTFEKFLYEISCGDKDLILCLEEILGYCITTSTKASKLFMLYGTGANGKSTYLNLIKKLVGKENVQSIPLKDFEKPFTRHHLKGILANVISEGDLSNSSTLISDTVKNFITSDDVSAEIKNGATYTYTPVLKIILATNRLPSEITSITYGEMRRILVIPFNQKFSGKQENRNLAKILDSELAGILNLALDGYKRLKRNNFIFSYEDKSNELLQNYLAKRNPLQMFIEKYVEEDFSSRVYYNKVFSKFCKYCKRNAIDTSYTQDIFSRQFRKEVANKYSNIKICHAGSERGLEGIRLKE